VVPGLEYERLAGGFGKSRYSTINRPTLPAATIPKANRDGAIDQTTTIPKANGDYPKSELLFCNGVLSRRPPLCVPSGYCLRQTPSVPPIGYRCKLLDANMSRL
jgi:hypothetical protein